MKARLQANGDPELAHIQELSSQFEVSFEAAARRLVELSEYACAVVFSDPEEWHELIASWWVKERHDDDMPESIYEQTLCQESGYKVTLLSLG